MSEVWRDVIGYEGLYQVSNFGRVKALAHFRAGVGKGGGGRWYQEKIIKHAAVGRGYHMVGLYKNGTQTSLLVHRLVAEAFIPNPDNRPQVNHKNGIKADCSEDNLEWATSKENNEHAMKTGLTLPGSNAYKGKVAIGTVHARLTVIGALDDKKRVLCRCECGNEKTISRHNLGRSVKSCGCLNAETSLKNIAKANAMKKAA